MCGAAANARVATTNRTAAEIQSRKECSDANDVKYQDVVSYKGGQWSEQLIGSEILTGFTASTRKFLSWPCRSGLKGAKEEVSGFLVDDVINFWLKINRISRSSQPSRRSLSCITPTAIRR
jgi:hypothetical protein